MTVRFIASAVIAALLLSGPVSASEPKSAATQAITAQTATVTEAQARDIALQHAGLTAEAVTQLQIKFDRDPRTPEWEVRFRHGDNEHEYEIHAETGVITDWDRAYDPQAPRPTDTEAAQALQIALQHAGLTAEAVTRVKTEKDLERGKWVFEVEFHHGDWEYSYEICAETGAILDWEKELED